MHTIENMCCALDGKWQCSNELNRQAMRKKKKKMAVFTDVVKG